MAARRPKTKELTLADDEIAIADVKTGQAAIFPKRKLDKEIRKIKSVLEDALSSIKNVGNYNLDSFEISIGVDVDLIVVAANGGVRLTYKLTGSQL